MRIKLLFLILVSSAIIINAQCRREWFPSNLNIRPFTANFLEPRAGFSYLLDKREIRLDIGHSEDIFHYKKGRSTLSFGADLFTFTRLTGERDFHFPVTTVDYLFGINAGYKVKKRGREMGLRFRLSHISAHFVDGHFDHRTQVWKDNMVPRVYSREFVELFPYYRIRGFRLYAGLTYLFHTTPKDVGRGIYQFGFDYYMRRLHLPFTPYLAYDFKLMKISKYSGNHIAMAGIKFGRYNSRGFSLYFAYYAGKSIHGEYYDVNENYASVGFGLDF